MGIEMKSRTVGLRVSCLIFALICLAHVARLGTRTDVIVAGHHFGSNWSVVAVVISGVLSIWLAKLSGPWCSEISMTPGPKR